MTLRPIGVVRSDVRERAAMPPFGAPARVVLFPEFAGGLLRFEKHSHVWVLAWLGGAERDVVQVTPRGVAGRNPEGLHGVFAVRSPARPNPIGLTAARVLERDGLSIALDRLDFLDGTEVIDLKPYFTARDLIFSATNAPIGRLPGREALREGLLVRALNFHGERCAGLALGVRIVEHFRAALPDLAEPEQWSITAPLGRPCLIDALMGMTHATPGRGNLRFHTPDSVRFEYFGNIFDYRILVTAEEDADRVLEAPDELLFSLR